MKDIDIITLSVVQKALENIAYEMAIVLRKTAYSPNIKERRDFSCAIFNEKAEIIASKDGIPVHLGSMDLSVEAGINKFKNISKGDVLIHNTPHNFGTHLPDITLYTPVFINQNDKPTFFIACRAHHSDVGGKTPGSMPGYSASLFEEGIQIPPIKLWEKNLINSSIFDLILANVRTPKERYGDFYAQKAALTIGEKRLIELLEKFSLDDFNKIISELANRSEKAMIEQIRKIPINQEFTASDFMDSDGSDKKEPIEIKVSIQRKQNNPDRLIVDFTGSAEQRKANINATRGITRSALFYCLRYLLYEIGDLPTNYGLWRPLDLILPENSIVNSSYPYATSSGNVETSQRLVDVIFLALSPINSLKVPAASQGTMNNILIGGYDSRPNKNEFFSYYETLAGGSGGTPDGPGLSGVHTHMTNTLNTPVEAIEISYPIQIKKYEIRLNSGGSGKFAGGDGLIREYIILSETASVSLQTERRLSQPYGLFNGENGLSGKNIKHSDQEEILPDKITLELKKNDRLTIFTPGGGGYGRKQQI
ncbi:MAG: Acetophenone carboxylase delta subunit [Candidatus Heimdallarchaeota archaeon LC_3]|nr:MAG: Acetophenone carboxylase delta subunit [Candidatus Heimdallarchaeota archaeon LC_3]